MQTHTKRLHPKKKHMFLINDVKCLPDRQMQLIFVKSFRHADALHNNYIESHLGKQHLRIFELYSELEERML